ncbi:MAG: glycosyltransferase family A protein [Candidatus Daviesbacteria bacterium]|nr:glycosyltransferase family A protein [Candidatus Daviesbacteria bacterium]
MPTNGKRPDGLKYQIDAILNQSYKPIRLWLLNDTGSRLDIHREDDRLFKEYVPIEHTGNAGHNAIRWAIENLPLKGEYIYLIGDDDCLTPWAINELVAGSDNADITIAYVVAVHRDYTVAPEILGSKIELGKITGSCCLFKADKLKKFGWDNSSYISDWIVIDKFIKSGCVVNRVKKIIAVMPQFK